MGPARQLLRRMDRQRLQAAAFISIQLLVRAGRQIMSIERIRPRRKRRIALILCGAAACVVAVAVAVAAVAAQSQLAADKALNAALAKYRGLKAGKNADYIP